MSPDLVRHLRRQAALRAGQELLRRDQAQPPVGADRKDGAARR